MLVSGLRSAWPSGHVPNRRFACQVARISRDMELRLSNLDSRARADMALREHDPRRTTEPASCPDMPMSGRALVTITESR